MMMSEVSVRGRGEGGDREEEILIPPISAEIRDDNEGVETTKHKLMCMRARLSGKGAMPFVLFKRGSLDCCIEC